MPLRAICVLSFFGMSAAACWKMPKDPAQYEVEALKAAVEMYHSQTGKYPGEGVAAAGAAMNQFPRLYEALVGTGIVSAPSNGKVQWLFGTDSKKLVILDEEGKSFRSPLEKERQNMLVDKYVVDPWGNPYIYRIIGSPVDGTKIQLYSLGPNGVDESIDNDGDTGDDMGGM